MPVYFAVDTRRVPDETLLAALAEAGRLLDETPTTMMAVCADQGPIRWFTFRCSSFAKGRALAGGFFQDLFVESLPEWVCVEVGDVLASDLVFTARTAERRLCVRSNGSETIVTEGSIAAEIPRGGDAVDLGLAALEWPRERTFESMKPLSARVVLRKKRAVVADPVWEAGGGRLPSVGVIVSGSHPRFERYAERASERSAIVAKKIAAKRSGKSGKRDKPIRVDFRVGKTAAMVDLAEATRITGKLSIIDNYAPGSPYGVKEVDLGGVEELAYPGTLYVQGETLAIRGPKLVKADNMTLHLKGDPEVSFPLLCELRWASIGFEPFSHISTLELPSLEKVSKTLTLRVGRGPFTIRFPRLIACDVKLYALSASELHPDSVFEAPLLERRRVEVHAREPAVREALAALVARGTRPD